MRSRAPYFWGKPRGTHWIGHGVDLTDWILWRIEETCNPNGNWTPVPRLSNRISTGPVLAYFLYFWKYKEAYEIILLSASVFVCQPYFFYFILFFYRPTKLPNQATRLTNTIFSAQELCVELLSHRDEILWDLMFSRPALWIWKLTLPRNVYNNFQYFGQPYYFSSQGNGFSVLPWTWRQLAFFKICGMYLSFLLLRGSSPVTDTT
jgi:hypothetical protein